MRNSLPWPRSNARFPRCKKGVFDMSKRRVQKLMGLGFLPMGAVVCLMADATAALVFIPTGLYFLLTRRVWVI